MNWKALPIGPRSRGGGTGEPAAWIVEDDHLSPLGRTQLFDDDPVVDLQRALHRDRGDQEHLTDEIHAAARQQ